MAAILVPNDGLSSRYDGTKRDSHILLDRFWDSLVIPASEPANIEDSPSSIGSSNYEQPRVRTPEIFTKRGSTPVLNVKSLRSSVEYRRNDRIRSEGSMIPFGRRPAASHERATPEIRIDYTGPVLMPQRNPGPSTVPRSLRPGERKTRRPKLSIPSHSHRSTTGITSPVTAVLVQASRFLGNIVKRGRSRPSTPIATGYMEDGDVQVVGSEVTINVVDDAVRCGQNSDSATNRYGMIDILGSPYISETDDDWSAGIPHLSIDGNIEAGSAREVDAISKLRWDRQLLRAQRGLQRINENGSVPI